MSADRWNDLEADRGFVVWGTDPFRLSNGTTYRFAIIQKWPGAGLIWRKTMVEHGTGRVVFCSGAYDFSAGSFYDYRESDTPPEGSSRNAIIDASRSATAKMAQLIQWDKEWQTKLAEHRTKHCSGSWLGRYALPAEVAANSFACHRCGASFRFDADELKKHKPQFVVPAHAPIGAIS